MAEKKSQKQGKVPVPQSYVDILQEACKGLTVWAPSFALNCLKVAKGIPPFRQRRLHVTDFWTMFLLA